MPLRKPSEGGFSLIQILVSMAVLGLIIFLYFQAQSRSQQARKVIDSTLASGDVKDALLTEVAAAIRQVNGTTPGCLDFTAQFQARQLVKASGSSSMTFTANVKDQQWISNQLDAAQKLKIQNQLNIGPWAAAARRCQSPQKPRNPNLDTDNRFYLCLAIRGDAAAAPNTFLSAPFAFVELGWTLTNLHDGTPYSCSGYTAASKSAGAQVFYSIYWAVPVNSDYVIKKSSDSFTLGK